MHRIKKNLLILALFTITISNAYAERNWINLGNSALGKWNIFIDKDSIKKMDDGIYVAITYQDLGVLQQGVDEYDEKGNHKFNKMIKYRSYRSIDLYDCKKKMIGHIETRYYKGEKPNKDTLVLSRKEENPIWLKVIIEKKIFNFVCEKGAH